MNNVQQGKRRRYIEVGLAIVCLVVLWAANVKTGWVPRAAEAARARIVSAAKEREASKGPTDELANEPLAHTSSQEKENANRPVCANTRQKVTAEELLEKDFELKKESLQAEFNQQWDIVNHSFGPTSYDTPDSRAARNRSLGNLHAKYAVWASRLTSEYRMRMKKLADIDRLARAGMLREDPNEAKMRVYLSNDVEEAALSGEKER